MGWWFRVVVLCSVEVDGVVGVVGGGFTLLKTLDVLNLYVYIT